MIELPEPPHMLLVVNAIFDPLNLDVNPSMSVAIDLLAQLLVDRQFQNVFSHVLPWINS